jgi:hypothetical protein
MTNQKAIEQVRKLIALSSSHNENEAKAALALAQKIMLKNGLDSAQLEEKTYDQKEIDSITRLKPHTINILGILSDYYQVQHIQKISRFYNNGKLDKVNEIMLIGEPDNIAMAEFIYTYLNRLFPSLFSEYRRQTGCPLNHKKTFYQGLTRGIENQLDATKKQVEQEHGLIIVKDKGIANHLDKLYPRAKEVTHKAPIRSREAYNQGIATGKSINLSRPIPSKKSMQKLLG